MKLFLCILVLLIFCPAEASAGKRLLAMSKEVVLKMTEDMTCTQSTDCVAVPMGARACGGPQSHVIVVPSQLKDSAKFYTEIARYTDDMKSYNLNNQMTGTCSVVMPPMLMCKDNICHIQAEAWDSKGVKAAAVPCRLAGEVGCSVQ
jgi:hypothetical protein